MNDLGNGGGQTAEKVVFVSNAIYQPLSVNGDGTGNFSQNVDGDPTPVKFFIQPPTLEEYTLMRMNVHAIALNFNDALQYANIGALANGIRIYVENDVAIIKEYTEFVKIKRSHDWALVAGVDAVNIGGSNADPLMIRWTFERGAGNIVLNGKRNERFVVEIPDDLSGMDDQICMVQGSRRFLT